MNVASLIRTCLLLGLLLPSVALAQPGQTEPLFPAPFAVGGAIQVSPTVAGVGTIRYALEPVVLDLEGGRTIGSRNEPLTTGSLDVSIPWARRSGFLSDTYAVSLIGLGLSLVDTEDAKAALGPSFVNSNGLFLGRHAEFFLSQRIGVILLADADANSFRSGDVVYAFNLGFRLYP